MANSTFAKETYTLLSTGSASASVLSMVIGVATHPDEKGLMVATGGLVAAGVFAAAMRGHDAIGRWSTVRNALHLSEDAVGVTKPKDIWKLSQSLQELEYSIDTRLLPETDQHKAQAKVAMGAWVHATQQCLVKASLVAEQLPSGWPAVETLLQHRMKSYNQLLKFEPARELSGLNFNM